MEKKDAFTKILAVIGSLLIWLPILAPVVLAVGFLISTGQFRFDFLMPAELFPSVLIGGLLLIWASIRTNTYQKLIGWGLAVAIILLFGVQALAEVTGLASGETEPTAWLMALIFVPFGIYVLSLAAVGIGGVLLSRGLFKHPIIH